MFKQVFNYKKQLNKNYLKNVVYKQKVLFSEYVQGQEPEPRIREYFYYIDHQGMLFLDDAKMKNFTSCFKEKKFLQFFFKNIKLNETNRYKDIFPFISLCGVERNYIRCDDLPIVYTHILNNTKDKDMLSFGYAGDSLTFNFQPDKIYMSPTSGRVYHPATNKYGGIGLIRSKLAIELSKYFEFKNSNDLSPTNFIWNDNNYVLDKNWINNTIKNTKAL